MISLLAKEVLFKLKEAFPNTRIQEEHYVSFEGQRLFFDFYIPTLSILVEVQGIQHTSFTPHFHENSETFKAAKKRDRLKKEWCDINDMTLVCINYNEVPMEINDLLQKIEEAQNCG